MSDSAELSYVQTGGNTDVTTLAAKNSLKYNFSDRAFATWKMDALYGQTDGEKTAERYETKLRGDYRVSKRLYWYGLGSWFQDKFAGIDSRYYGGMGIGYPLLTGEKHTLAVELGLNYTREEYSDETENDFWEGRSFGVYEYALNSTAKFSQTVEYLYNFEDSRRYKANAATSFITAINKIISLKISYEIRYDNQPIPETLKRTDTLFSSALVVNF